jgi:hypothetical protein
VTSRSGEGQISWNGGTFAVHANQQAVISGQDQNTQYQVYAAPALDQFDNWALLRERRFDRRASSRYVSPYVVGSEDLDDYGDWRSYPNYGEVWVPRGVRSGWAPYQYGHWAWVEPWGWSWVDDAPWGFAPFHYGRWAYVGNTWGWVPCPVQSRPYYAPALVAWFGFGGGGGLFSSFGFGGGASVGWFPLGPRDVYIPAYRASPSYVSQINTTNTTYINNTYVTNIYNNYVRSGTVPITSYGNRAVPGAVVTVPQAALAGARPVQQVVTRIQPAQLKTVQVVAPAPRVAPQVASVFGRAPSRFSSVPHPPPAVISKPVVAKVTPPPAPAPFQQRQALLAKDPGRPISIQQQRQIAAPKPPVRVVTQVRPVTPQVINHPAPQPAQPQQGGHAPAPAVAQHPSPAPQARPYEPPSAQHPSQPAVRAQAPPPQEAHPGQQPQQPAARSQAPRPFEPPSAQHQQPQPPVRAQAPAPHAQPNAAPHAPAARPPAPVTAHQAPPHANQPQPAQPHPQPAERAQAPPPRPAPPPQARPAQPRPMQGEASRAAPPPRAQAPAPKPAQAAHPARPAHPQPQEHKKEEEKR